MIKLLHGARKDVSARFVKCTSHTHCKLLHYQLSITQKQLKNPKYLSRQCFKSKENIGSFLISTSNIGNHEKSAYSPKLETDMGAQKHLIISSNFLLFPRQGIMEPKLFRISPGFVKYCIYILILFNKHLSETSGRFVRSCTTTKLHINFPKTACTFNLSCCHLNSSQASY